MALHDAEQGTAGRDEGRGERGRKRMKSWRKAILWGLAVWLVPFVIALAAFSLKESWRSLFESIMALSVALITVIASARYLRATGPATWEAGARLGLLWFAISVLIDLPLMLSPPINYTLMEYAADIGLTYGMIPVITTGMALAASQLSKSRS